MSFTNSHSKFAKDSHSLFTFIGKLLESLFAASIIFISRGLFQFTPS